MAEEENTVLFEDAVKNRASMSIRLSSSNVVKDEESTSIDRDGISNRTVKGDYFSITTGNILTIGNKKGEYWSIREGDVMPDQSTKGEYFSIRDGNVLSDQGIPSNTGLSKAKFMCSSGGKILPRPLDMKLRYVGGQNRMISVPRNIRYDAFLRKMMDIYGPAIVLRYQLPDEDLDALVSVSSDEDLENMMEECDRLHSAELSVRLRVFVFQESEVDSIDIHEMLNPKASEKKFVDAINTMSFDLPSREATRSELVGSYLNNCTSSFDPWDAIQMQQSNPVLHHRTENFSLVVNTSSENILTSNVASSPAPAEKSHPIPMFPLDEYIGESAVTETTTQEKIIDVYSRETGQDDFHGLEYGSLNCLPLSLQQQRSRTDYADSEQYPEPRTHKESEPNVDGGSEKDTATSEHSGLQEDLNNLGLEDHHQNTDSKWQGALRTLELREECQKAEETSSMNFSEFKTIDQFPLELRIANRVIPHQTLDEGNVFQEISAYEEASCVLGIMGSGHTHEQSFTSPIPLGNSLDNFSTGPSLLPREWNVDLNREPKLEHVPADDDSLISCTCTLDSIGVPYSTTSGTNQRASQADEGHCMHRVSLNTKNTRPNLFSGLNQVFKDDLLYQNDQQDWLEKVSEDFEKYKRDTEVFSKVSHSPHIFVAEKGSGQEESNAHGSMQNHNQENLISPIGYMSQPLDIISDLLSCLPQENLEVGSPPSVPLHFVDGFPYHGGDSLSTGEAVTAEDVCHPQLSDQRGSEDPAFHSIENSMTSKGQFDRISAACKSTFNNDTVLDEDSLSKVREHGDTSGPHPVKSLALASLIETWEASLLQDDDHMQNAGVLDVVHAEVREVDRVEESGVELEEHDDFQSFDFGPRNVASIAEEEAKAHGLQTIRNCDLEDLRELGSGTFGTVYHGKWRGSDVAIKRIKASCFAGRPNERNRLMADFWREAYLLSQLHHPNVVAFYGVVPDGPGGTFATVTEYMVNGSLKQVLQRKDRTLDRRKRLLIAMDAAFGMEYLHGKNVVHFDIKCENLLVNMRDIQRPICKVGDLGLSKVKQQTFVSGGVRGTLPWMAPELLNGNSSLVSEKVDVYSFGIVMWELITGEEPYANMHYGAIIGGIVNNTLRPTIPRSCDPAWRSLMEKCWAADATSRPTFSEIARTLRAMEASLNLKGQT